jgi:hypothetical protein
MKWFPPVLIIIPVVLLAMMWFCPLGASKYEDSPDRKWTARVSSFHRGTLTGRLQFLEIEILDARNESTVVDRRLECTSTDKIPNYSNRDIRHIVWSSDSKVATFEIANQQKISIEIPTTAVTAAR